MLTVLSYKYFTFRSSEEVLFVGVLNKCIAVLTAFILDFISLFGSFFRTFLTLLSTSLRIETRISPIVTKAGGRSSRSCTRPFSKGIGTTTLKHRILLLLIHWCNFFFFLLRSSGRRLIIKFSSFFCFYIFQTWQVACILGGLFNRLLFLRLLFLKLLVMLFNLLLLVASTPLPLLLSFWLSFERMTSFVGWVANSLLVNSFCKGWIFGQNPTSRFKFHQRLNISLNFSLLSF